jgi:hypothetical protein
MAFEKYDKGTGRGTNQPRVSLRRSDTIGINGPAIAEHFDGVDGVVLYYDEDENRVGLEPADADESDAYTLVENNNADSATVNAMGFMTEFGLAPEQTTHYDAQWDDDQELVYVDLDDPVKTYGNGDEDEEE